MFEGEVISKQMRTHDAAELWDIKLIRTVNAKRIRYEMTIDNCTGELFHSEEIDDKASLKFQRARRLPHARGC